MFLLLLEKNLISFSESTDWSKKGYMLTFTPKQWWWCRISSSDWWTELVLYIENSHHRISTLPKNPINTDDNGFGNLHESIIRTAQQEEGMMKKCRYLSTIALARRGEQKKDIMWLALCSKHTLKRCFLHQSNNSNNVPRQKSFSCSASLNNLFDFDLIWF